jgi:hypothetical protein
VIGLGLFLLIVSIPASNFHPIAWKLIVDEVITGDASTCSSRSWG